MEAPEPMHFPPLLCNPHGLASLGLPLKEKVQNQKPTHGFKPSKGFLTQMPCCDDPVPLSSGPVCLVLCALRGHPGDSFEELLRRNRHHGSHRTAVPMPFLPRARWKPSLIWMYTHLFSSVKHGYQWSFLFFFLFLKIGRAIKRPCFTEKRNVHKSNCKCYYDTIF